MPLYPPSTGGAAGVSDITAGTGLQTTPVGPNATGSVIVKFADVANNTIMANISGGTLPPSAETPANVAALCAPFIATNNYGAGLYNGQIGQTSGTIVGTVNRIVYVPIVCPGAGLSVQAISFRITSAGTGGNVQAALYSQVSGAPSALLISSASATVPASTGTVDIPLSTTTPGSHFFACLNFGTATTQPTCISTTGLYTGRTFAAATLANMLATVNTLFIQSSTFSTWPSTATPSITGADVNVWVKYT